MTRITALTAAVALGLGSQAFADRVDLNVYDSNVDASAVSVYFDAVDNGDTVDFIFKNEGPGSVAKVYFEAGLRNYFQAGGSSAIPFMTTGDAAFAHRPNVDPHRPYNDSVVDYQANMFSIMAQGNSQGVTENGLNDTDDSLKVTFTKLDSNTSLDDILGTIGTTGYRVAAYLKGLGPASKVGLISDETSLGGPSGGPVVPVPAAIWPGLAIVGALAARRRREA